MCNLYEIKCELSGRRYVGMTVNVAERWRRHERELLKGIHHCIQLQRAFNKYGASAFTFNIIERYDSVTLASDAELDLLRTETTLYNSAKYSRVGGTISEEHRKRISEGTKKAMQRPEVREKLGVSRRGIAPINKGVRNPNSKHEIKLRNTTRRGTPEFTAIMSKAQSKKLWSGFIDPMGNTVAPFYNLTGFAKQHNLKVQGLHRLTTGHLKRYKGWTHAPIEEN